MPRFRQQLLLFFSLMLVNVVFTPAEILPVKTYTSADGLLRDAAFCIKQDSRGFLWFCTSDGLSRFDGYGFTNYTTDDGLPQRNVADFLETRDGFYWVATAGGLARFNPHGKRGGAMFTSFKPPDKDSAASIEKLFEDSRGVLWCGTNDGFYRVELSAEQVIFHRVELPKEHSNNPQTVTAIAEDSLGNILVGMDFGHGLNRISPDGKIEHFRAERENGKPESFKTLLKTANGEILAGLSVDGGLCSLVSKLNSQTSIFSKCFSKKDGLPSNWITSLFQTSDNKIWLGTSNGAADFDSSSWKIRIYRQSQGLCEDGIHGFFEDRDRNLWIVANCGVKKIVSNGIVRFGTDDGLASNKINGVFASPNRELFFITQRTTDKNNISLRQINRFVNNRFTFAEPKLPPNVNTGWGGGQIAAQENSGEWWLGGSSNAVYRFPQTNNFQQLDHLKTQTIKIPDSEVFRIYRDSRGDVWVSTIYNGHLLKWNSATQNLTDFKNEISPDNFVRHTNHFAEDAAGTLWISTSNSEDLIRYKDGDFSIIKVNSERKLGNINTVFFDSQNRLWLATMLNGVGRVDDSSTNELNAVWYNRKNGLATDGTRGLGEDKYGRIYVAHGRGVDRIDANTGHIKHFTTADGLPPDNNYNIARDQDGNLWFGGLQGLARLVPEPDKPRQSPNILLTGLRVNSEIQTVSELGEFTLPELNLDSGQTQVSIDFLGLGASLGEEIKYQYKLQGDWVETTQRTVDFANLAPGTYNFQVRAVTFDGLISQNPATVTFTIAAPIWQRWWFIALSLLLLGGGGYLIYRYRVNRLLEVERVRTRIATDLHDDIGANLSKISVLSEVARLQMTNGNEENNRLLGSIAEIARESVGTMSDIVWAINPKRDSVLEMSRKMREHAEETFVPKNVTVEFNSPIESEKIKLPMNLRREIYLIYKEAINNAAKHSNCGKVEIEFKVDAKEVFLQIKDNGIGFQTNSEASGNGLENMKIRAQNLGGKLEINSAEKTGTVLKLKVLW